MTETKPSDEEVAKINLARETAKVLQMSMAGVPREVQIEAAFVLLEAQVIANVKPAHMISLFNSATRRVRDHLKEYLKLQRKAK